MNKSERTLIVDEAVDLLSDCIDEELFPLLDEAFSEGGFVGIVSEGPIRINVIARRPSMMVSFTLRANPFAGFEDSVTCIGQCRLKGGDKWSSREGWGICCKRAARHLANQVLGKERTVTL